MSHRELAGLYSNLILHLGGVAYLLGTGQDEKILVPILSLGICNGAYLCGKVIDRLSELYDGILDEDSIERNRRLREIGEY